MRLQAHRRRGRRRRSGRSRHHEGRGPGRPRRQEEAALRLLRGRGLRGAPNLLRPYGDKVAEADFLLFNLGWDEYWGTDAYFGDYPCIDDEVLDLIIAGGYKGIGFDVIGLDPIADTNLTRHKKLFSSCDIVNIENLKNLDCCGDDLFWFSCCPLKIEDSDGAPISAIAWFE